MKVLKGKQIPLFFEVTHFYGNSPWRAFYVAPQVYIDPFGLPFLLVSAQTNLFVSCQRHIQCWNREHECFLFFSVLHLLLYRCANAIFALCIWTRITSNVLCTFKVTWFSEIVVAFLYVCVVGAFCKIDNTKTIYLY